MAVLIALFKLIRVGNLFMLMMAQSIFYFFIFPKTNVLSSSNFYSFLLLTLATVLIAAGGYIINDYFDIECDRINKPNKSYIPKLISKNTAIGVYLSTSIMGLLLAYLLAIHIENMQLTFVFSTIILSLFIYSKYLKKYILIGNILISVLVASNILVLLYLIQFSTHTSYGVELLVKFSFFSFFINLVREIIKDIEDIKGDYNTGMKTTPILLGIDRTKKLIYIVSIIPVYLMIRFFMDDLKENTIAQIFYFVFVLTSLLLFFIKLKTAKAKQDFHFLSTLLKGILLFGLLLIFLIIH